VAGKRNHAEDALQRQCAGLLDQLGVLWFHPPLGGYRRKREAARLKSHGAKPGIPDILIFEPWADYPDGELFSAGFGMAIELKLKGTYPKPHQKAWLKALED
jgi:hypothetical protein